MSKTSTEIEKVVGIHKDKILVRNLNGSVKYVDIGKVPKDFIRKYVHKAKKYVHKDNTCTPDVE